ncbi:hypothetical protein Natpe_1187 [Natrinema pellirubrum DSM 15624]|uniref:Uncharacterized protein n=1 Tax=Natrinema pellirubrum (strain DSM 15624 / CIP 106293 / JCM 10476 / NCIMB 786 / 157) TaxID=797303 RepID=L0JIE8_NATP1|nr:surface glycoprotein [Natrinema pellirubrum]AGB31094.1 hypothetical protein Natpe_1187 [Natrinema pellirubrum DSM 15624]
MSTTREKVRATVFAALMVMSVVAMSTAVAGSAAALDTGPDISVDNTDLNGINTTNDDTTYTIDVAINDDITSAEVDGIRVDLDDSGAFGADQPNASSVTASDVSLSNTTVDVDSVDSTSTNGVATGEDSTLEIALNGTESYSSGDVALLQRRIAPVSALFSADFREACGELDAVLRYEVETADHTAV